MLIPLLTKNSRTLSSEALSLMPGSTIGEMFLLISPNVSDCRRDSLVLIQSLLPRMVLISPLCPIILKGWARLHVGNVFVENLACTRAMELVKYLLVRSGKYLRNCLDFTIPLYTMVRVERLTT